MILSISLALNESVTNTTKLYFFYSRNQTEFEVTEGSVCIDSLGQLQWDFFQSWATTSIPKVESKMWYNCKIH